MPKPLAPLIAEPKDDPTPPSRPGDYLLYDEDFPVDTNPRYAPLQPGRKLHTPHFPVSEVARLAFADRINWLRHQLKGKPWTDAMQRARSTPLLLQGKPLTFRTVASAHPSGERRFTLPDIERLAWALYERHDIDGHDLQRITRILAAVADQYHAHTKKGRR
ncbi:DUF7229 domain-containing protein [Streptomyces griseoaurantiacus]|uniref:DUF7229 domain-containing protein n=1 Tax=Streptomyces griseoaurantiacus TaxID=68213 RepID=UPI0036763F72